MDCYKVMKINSTLKLIERYGGHQKNYVCERKPAASKTLSAIWRWYTILNNYIMIQRHNNYQRAVIPNFTICMYPLAICISLFSLLGLSIQIVYILNMKWSVILVIYICNFIFVLSKITILY